MTESPGKCCFHGTQKKLLNNTHLRLQFFESQCKARAAIHASNGRLQYRSCNRSRSTPAIFLVFIQSKMCPNERIWSPRKKWLMLTRSIFQCNMYTDKSRIAPPPNLGSRIRWVTGISKNCAVRHTTGYVK